MLGTKWVMVLLSSLPWFLLLPTDSYCGGAFAQRKLVYECRRPPTRHSESDWLRKRKWEQPTSQLVAYEWLLCCLLFVRVLPNAASDLDWLLSTLQSQRQISLRIICQFRDCTRLTSSRSVVEDVIKPRRLAVVRLRLLPWDHVSAS